MSLNTVSLRTRSTTAVIAVLALVLVLTGVIVNAVFVAQSERSLDALLADRVQLARQLARGGLVGPLQIVRRIETDGVRAHLVLRNGTEFGTPALDTKEAQARRLQFRSGICVLDAYLYPKGGGEPVVTFIDAREPDVSTIDRASCIAALTRRGAAP